VSPVKYELGFYISEDGILQIDSRGNLKSYKLKNVGSIWSPIRERARPNIIRALYKRSPNDYSHYSRDLC
jgi:hypothetical protein